MNERNEEEWKLRLFTLYSLNGYSYLWEIIFYSIKIPLIYELTTNYVLIKEKRSEKYTTTNIEKYFCILFNNNEQ